MDKLGNCVVEEHKCDPIESNENATETLSAENFQKFIYDMFENNGILNDLRAYLRRHIIGILKSAQTGEPPASQKNFTQGLELKFQALNILIVEYLLCLDFNYTLSVFVSELPLANMVFRFAKSLMHRADGVYTGLRFEDTDVWSILNYLGVKCDSEHAANIVDMYRNDRVSPLLLCILKCIPMYKEFGPVSSNESESSCDTLPERSKNTPGHSLHDKCKHYFLCKTCQSRVRGIKEKYRRKKRNLTKTMTESCEHSMNLENVMKNIGVMERSLIDEMFVQLKSVYETEMEMVKVEEDKKVKRSVASHAEQLQERTDQMEASFRAREAQLELSVQHKKRFLWGLARALRDQHRHMAAAMLQLRRETLRLQLKEDSLKTQLAEAEQILKQRGEDMREQISRELNTLEGHIDSMKRERDNINRERSELEDLRSESKSNVARKDDNEGLRLHYELLRDELAILKKYVESAKLQPKCLIERSTTTDGDVAVCLLNNAQDERDRVAVKNGDKLKASQLVNDLKKHKNVNFSQSNLEEIYRERSRERSRSSASSEAGDASATPADDELLRLRRENDNLKAVALQQRLQISQLTAQARPPRPRTAPAVMPQHTLQRSGTNGSASATPLSSGWCKGAGEDLSVFSNAQPRILVPGDTLPFIGVLRDRHPDPRRHLINQWRALRRRSSPLRAKPLLIDRPGMDLALKRGSAGATLGFQFEPRPGSSSEVARDQPDCLLQTKRDREHLRPKTATDSAKRDISPLSILREAKQRLRNKDTCKERPAVPRTPSPSGVLREAKLRLRKLEIEAEAAERSYRHFRRRQSQMRHDRTAASGGTDLRDQDDNRDPLIQQLGETYHDNVTDSLGIDADRYLREYQAKYDISDTHFSNKTTAAQSVKPIPAGFSMAEDDKAHTDYLETPMDEFRKFYRSDHNRFDRPDAKPQGRSSSSVSSDNCQVVCTKEKLPKTKDRGAEELEILKQNIGKIYNLPNEAALEESEPMPDVEKTLSRAENDEPSNANRIDNNLLTVEVESEVNSLKISDSQTQDLLLVIRSSGETRDLAASEPEELTPHMTIIISPKHTSARNEAAKSPIVTNCESADLGTRSMQKDAIAAILNSDKPISSVNLDIELSKEVLEESMSDILKANEDYPDDFSADVDNYNSRSEYENNSPISLVKTSEDEHFWDT